MCEAASWDLAGRATYGLSEFYFREGDFQNARVWAERVPEQSRRYVDARSMIGDVESQLGHPRAALAAYLEAWNMAAVDLNSLAETAQDLTASANKALVKKDYWTAERFFRRALTLDMQQTEAAAGLSRAFVHFQHHEAALRWAEHAVRLDDRSAAAALAVCEAHLAKKDAPAARAALTRLQALAPGDPDVARLATRVAAL